MMTLKVMFMETESRTEVTRGWDKGGEESCCLMSTELQMCKKKHF